MKIGVAIPCYKDHLPKLQRCLESIEAQTLKPTAVIVSCSSSTTDEILAYKFPKYSFQVSIAAHKEEKNAAQNRNIAAKILLEHHAVDILSFFDADDEMHPQRLEAIHTAFEENPGCGLVVHSFYMKDEVNQPFVKKPFDIRVNYAKATNYGFHVATPLLEHVHHGHCSVSKLVYERIQFREEKEFLWKEDAKFCHEVASLPGIQTLYIKNELAKYYPSK
jgi:glycosyltransferase involved in cell wall biosynthesis